MSDSLARVARQLSAMDKSLPGELGPANVAIQAGGMKNFLRNLVLALIIGLGLFGIVAFMTFGFPFSFDYPNYIAFCHFTGCNTYEPLFVGLDYLFWAGIAFVLVSIAEALSARWGNEPREMRYDERAEVKFFAALFFFGSAILSLWLALSNPGIGISSWYIGALVLTIFGIIVLKLPAAVGKSNRNDKAR